MLPKTHYQNSYQPHFDARLYRLKSPSVPLLLPYLTLLCSPPLRSRSCLLVVANATKDNQQPTILQALLNSTKISLALCSTLPTNFYLLSVQFFHSLAHSASAKLSGPDLNCRSLPPPPSRLPSPSCRSA